MSRIYTAMTGAASARPAGVPTPPPEVPKTRPTAEPEWDRVRAHAGQIPDPELADADFGFVADSDDVPYVEIGGPNGAVFSAGPKPVPVAATTASAVPAARPEPPPAPREFPRLADAPRYLSVRFHDLTDRAKLKPTVEGIDPELVAFHFPDHPVSGEYRVLRDEIRRQLPEPTPKVLLFTAAAGEAGTTTVLLNLAVTLAAEGGPRVLVVDANVGKPAVGPKLGLKPAPGVAEVLALQVPLAWGLQTSVVANMEVLAAGAATGDTPKLLGEDLSRLAGQLRQWYDWVLIDGGVWGAVPERDASCPSADAVYLVTREADVDRTEFAGLRGWVKELGGLLRGFVTTRV
jgi:Mrp family chromosome partitioning ATPase